MYRLTFNPILTAVFIVIFAIGMVFIMGCGDDEADVTHPEGEHVEGDEHAEGEHAESEHTEGDEHAEGEHAKPLTSVVTVDGKRVDAKQPNKAQKSTVTRTTLEK